MALENLTVAEIAGGAAAALITMAMGLQAVLWRWKGTSAETDVIDMLRTEVKRLSNQNGALTTQLNKLQAELVMLHEQLSRMVIENGRLHAEVERLNDEIARLQQFMPQTPGAAT